MRRSRVRRRPLFLLFECIFPFVYSLQPVPIDPPGPFAAGVEPDSTADGVADDENGEFDEIGGCVDDHPRVWRNEKHHDGRSCPEQIGHHQDFTQPPEKIQVLEEHLFSDPEAPVEVGEEAIA